MRKTLGLALGSGGARGVAHIGFLQALEEEGIRADCVTGCSMGSIVGACYCAGIPVPTLKELALKLKLSSIASVSPNMFRERGALRLSKARKLLETHLGKEREFSELEIPFACVAVDIVTGKLVEMNEGNVVQAILASSSIPGVFTPALVGDMVLVDGGLLERVPTRELRRFKPDVVIAVDVLGDLTVKEMPTEIISTLLRCIDIADTRYTQQKKRSRVRNVDLWLEPELGAMSQYKVKNLQFAFDKGYELGKANMENIKKLLGE